jgi:hypothetical protein
MRMPARAGYRWINAYRLTRRIVSQRTYCAAQRSAAAVGRQVHAKVKADRQVAALWAQERSPSLAVGIAAPPLAL